MPCPLQTPIQTQLSITAPCLLGMLGHRQSTALCPAPLPPTVLSAARVSLWIIPNKIWKLARVRSNSAHSRLRRLSHMSISSLSHAIPIQTQTNPPSQQVGCFRFCCNPVIWSKILKLPIFQACNFNVLLCCSHNRLGMYDIWCFVVSRAVLHGQCFKHCAMLVYHCRQSQLCSCIAVTLL